MEIISLTVESNIAHFRQGFSTTSSLSYPFPTKTALVGFFGAILGIQRNELFSFSNEIKVGLVMPKEYENRKVTFGRNYMFGKNSKVKAVAVWYNKKSGRLTSIPVTQQMILFPTYKLFVKISNDKQEELYKRLKNRSPVFFPYFGSNFALASWKNVEKREMKKIKHGSEIQLDSVVPERCGDVLSWNQVFMIRIPKSKTGEMKVNEFENVFYTNPGKKLKCKTKEDIYEGGGECIALF